MPKIDNVIPLFRRGGGDAPQGGNGSSWDEAWQVSLPFDAPPLVFVVHSDVLSLGVDLRGFIGAVEPFAIFDLRKAPRLDFISPSRANSLAMLESMHVKYFDVLGRSGFSPSYASEGEFSEFITGVCGRVESMSKNDHPVVMLFDDSAFFLRCEQLFLENFNLEKISRESLVRFVGDESKARM